MHNLTADVHVTCRSVRHSKRPNVIERTFLPVRSALSTHRTVVAHTIHFAVIFDFQFLIELIKQFRIHQIISIVKAHDFANAASRCERTSLFADGRRDWISAY